MKMNTIRQKYKGVSSSSYAAVSEDKIEIHSEKLEVDPKYGRKGKFLISKPILIGYVQWENNLKFFKKPFFKLMLQYNLGSFLLGCFFM